MIQQAKRAKAAEQNEEQPKRKLSNATKVEMALRARNYQSQERNSVPSEFVVNQNKNLKTKLGEKELSSSYTFEGQDGNQNTKSSEPSVLLAKWLPVQKKKAFDFCVQPTVFENYDSSDVPTPPPRFSSEDLQTDSARESVKSPVPSTYWKPLKKHHSNSIKSETTV